MNQTEVSEMLSALATLAGEAGEAIMQVYRRDFEVEHKADDSPLTAADLASNRIIMAGLQELTPELPRLSEEGRDISFSERKAWRRYWLIDPLDGTREFVKKNGEFTVNIALVENGAPVLGVVYAPDKGQTYMGEVGVGAWKQADGGRPEPISTRAAQARPRILVSKSHRTAEVDRLLERVGDYEPVSVGSSLKFCLVAEGAADFYPRLGPTSEWDTAAGHAVVQAAGGRVTDTELNDLRYNQEESLLNPDFLVIGDPVYDWGHYLD